MQNVFSNFINVFIAVTLAAFIMSAIPTSAFASNPKEHISISHLTDNAKSDHAPSHQKDGQCDDGCCISHCFCAGYAVPTVQTLSVPDITDLGVLTLLNQKVESNPSTPQLRPPRILG